MTNAGDYSKYELWKKADGNYFVMKGDRVISSHEKDKAKAIEQVKELNDVHELN